MNTIGLKPLQARVRSWPKGAQEEAMKALRQIEEDFIIGSATTAELDLSYQAALRSEGMDMQAGFGRYNL